MTEQQWFQVVFFGFPALWLVACLTQGSPDNAIDDDYRQH